MFRDRYPYLDEEPSEVPATGGADAPVEQPEAQPEVKAEAPDDQAPVTEGATAEQPTEAQKEYFKALPDDWRAQALKSIGLSEEDPDWKKRLGQLERHTDIASVLKSGFEANDKIRKGEISTGLPEDATEEQVAEYRAANGIPEAPDGYEAKLEDGLVLSEEDDRIFKNVAEVAHAANIPGEVMSAMTNAMLKARQAEQEALIQKDGLDEQQATRQIKETWRGDYQTNLNMVNALASQLPETVRDAFLSARLADGRLMFNSPEVMVFFADAARKLNPTATVVPGSNNPIQSINEEIKKLEARMGDPDWHKDTDAQKRYQDLVTAKQQYGNVA